MASPSPGQVAMSGLGLKNQVAVADGTVGAPSVSFAGDVNTGIYRPGADVLGVVTGGVERMRVDAAGNVGIGVTSPAGALHMQGMELLMYNSVAPRIRVGMSIDSNCTIGYATGAGNFSTNAGLGDCIIRNNESNKKIHMQAGVGAAVVTVTNQSVGIGSTSPQATLDVAGSLNYTTTLTRNGATPPMAKYGRLVTKTASGRLNYYQKIYDTHNAVTTGTNWVFTVPANCSGFYYVDAFVYKNDSTLQYVDIAGSVFYRLWETSEIAFQGTGTVVKLNAGNTLYFNNATAASIGDAGGADGQYAYCTIACILLSP